jgi:hypothetical protein
VFNIIEHIFIVDRSGIPVYSRCIQHTCQLGQLDSFAVSGLLTALTNFAKEIGVGNLTAINVENSQLVIRNEEKFFATFQLELQDTLENYKIDLAKFSAFLNRIYPDTPPSSKEDRLRIITQVEEFLSKNRMLEKKGVFGKIKSYFSKLFHFGQNSS